MKTPKALGPWAFRGETSKLSLWFYAARLRTEWKKSA